MNEQVNKILVELLQKATNGIDAAVSFSQAQIPDVIHQLLVWNFTESVIFSLLGAMIFFVAQLGAWRALKYLRKEWEDDSISDHPEVIPIFCVWVVTLAPLGWIDLIWLKIWLAPKLYLLEYAAHLIK